MQKKGIIVLYWWQCKLVHSLQKTKFFKKLKVELPYDLQFHSWVNPGKNEYTTLKRFMDPSIHNSTIYEPRYGSNPNVHQQMNKEDVVCMHVCVCVCVCINTHTHNGILLYSVIIKNEMLPFTATQMQLENIMLNEISLIDKDKYFIIPFIC